MSQATAADLQRYYATSPAKIRGSTRLSRPCPRRRRERSPLRAAYGLQRPYALYIGSIQPRKNLARLIDAYTKLSQPESPEWDLALAGGLGWLSDPIIELAQSGPAAERIRLIGYVAEEHLPALLAAARFFCYPSLFEGFGLPVLEAQREERPS